jgi:branched-chain amino acid transport system ATP-binding protein
VFLDIKDLDVDYGKARALSSFSLEVEEGEVTAVVGANGAGKTTLLRTVSGLKRPTSGSIHFEGRRIDHLPAHRIARLGIVQIPANRMIVSTMSVLDNLKLGAHLRRDRQGVARDLAEMCEAFPILWERRSQLGGQLSGGQQQMLAVARALMAKPKLLLMDEPSTGLSPMMVAEVHRQITDISLRLRVSILLVEQNARMALTLARRAYIIELGRVVLEGAAAQLAQDERVKECYLGGL